MPASPNTRAAVAVTDASDALPVSAIGVSRFTNREECVAARQIAVVKAMGSRGGAVRKKRRQGVVSRIGWISGGGFGVAGTVGVCGEEGEEEGWVCGFVVGGRRRASSSAMEVSMSVVRVEVEVGGGEEVGLWVAGGVVVVVLDGVVGEEVGAGAMLSWIPYSDSAYLANRSRRSRVAFPSLPLVQVAQMPVSPGVMVGGAVCGVEEDFLGG